MLDTLPYASPAVLDGVAQCSCMITVCIFIFGAHKLHSGAMFTRDESIPRASHSMKAFSSGPIPSTIQSSANKRQASALSEKWQNLATVKDVQILDAHQGLCSVQIIERDAVSGDDQSILSTAWASYQKISQRPLVGSLQTEPKERL